MSEKLTDEQFAERFRMGAMISTEMHYELLELRAERAKPTQSDYSPTEHERSLAYDIIDTVTDPNIDDHDEKTEAVFLAFASIRAEGSAERAKLEAELEHSRALLRWIADGSNPKSKPSSPQPAGSGATEQLDMTRQDATGTAPGDYIRYDMETHSWVNIPHAGSKP